MTTHLLRHAALCLVASAAIGGVLVDPAHNLHYVEGSLSWAGVMPMAIIGVSRAFHIDLTPYLSEYGKSLYAKLEKASIAEVLAQYPGLTISSPQVWWPYQLGSQPLYTLAI